MYKIDFANCSASIERTLPSGRKKIDRFMLFIDHDGINILGKKSKVYLVPENMEVI